MFTTFPSRPIWQELDTLSRTFDRALGWGQSHTERGSVNVSANAEGAHIDALLPGYADTDLNVEVEGDVVTIAASKGDGDDRDTWTRRLRLPFAIDAGATKAAYADGVLSIDLARPAEDRPKKINISVN